MVREDDGSNPVSYPIVTKMRKRRKSQLLSLVIVILLALYSVWDGRSGSIEGDAATVQQESTGAQQLQDAFDKRQSDEWIEASGNVQKLLADDNDGSRHQRFVLRTSLGQSLLVAHNIDVAERVPLGMGDKIHFRGVYEWNERGGIVHWTHHDPMGRQRGGFIEYRGKRYE